MDVCSKYNIPMVMTLHDPSFVCPAITLMKNDKEYCAEKLCLKGSIINCARYICFKNDMLKSLIAFFEFGFRRKKLNKLSHVICVSKATQNLVLETDFLPDKLMLVTNFLDDSFFDKKPEYTNKGYFLYLGRLHNGKGVHYLIQAMKTLPDVKLRIAGTGPEEDNLKKQALESGLNNIEFLGFISDKELKEQYKNCIATVLPCNWFESFGLTNIESFAYGKPVIASNIGGISEIIDDYQNGILIEPGNIEKLAESIKYFNNNPDIVQKMGRNGRNKAEKLYNSRIHYENLMNVYNKALNLDLDDVCGASSHIHHNDLVNV